MRHYQRSASDSLPWVGDNIRHSGFAGTLYYYVQSALALVRDLSPDRRKSRYGDIDYDFENGVDTTWATVSLGTRFRELLSGGQYQPSDPDLFDRILEALPSRAEDLTFVDLGSGKGRALLMASNHPFRRIVGIELLKELNDVALVNIGRYSNPLQKCFNIESILADARGFAFPPEPTVLYLFNPFPEHVLREVLANLRGSLRSKPRETFLIYHNLVHDSIFGEQQWLEPIQRTHQFAIYRAVMPGLS